MHIMTVFAMLGHPDIIFGRILMSAGSENSCIGVIMRLYMIMAAAITLPTYPRSVKLLSSECITFKVMALGLYAMSYKPTGAFGRKLNSHGCLFCVPEPLLVNNFKRISWSIRSSVDNNGLDPSPTNGSTGTTRLIRVIQDIQAKLGARIGEIRRGLPMKIFFFLVGFYCSTAYSTVIGQTGDWDILSAAFAMLIVEGIGALMYKASLPLLEKTKSLITKFNYWKAGLVMGLFLDSFKYEIDDIFGFSNPFSFVLDALSVFL
uniref:uncharacterized protein LOC101301253 isoform X1 n=2 Tax=Fragaria vesca subsp. vesca TaxID=101020 RepID=UPI0005CB26DE|nr:PREDICTED: uncharacterized protein LOC101301253 isoform X1 [Fragaria vesca subsp. vesca]XP_011469154.1 PREDICTED: uncharacterized protein LOC101301253 isoform X1 [Fragaria vesca subsp. vesca]